MMRGDTVVLAGGEDRPGHRSAAVLQGRLAPTSRPFAPLDYAVLAAYFVPLLLIGRYFSTKNESTEDFFLGGRRVPWWAAGLSIYGTQLSAITFLAIPAKAYAEDWVFLLANLCILAIAPVVVFFYLPFFRGLQITTAYEYLERRFGLAVRLAGSLAFIVLQAARMAIVLFLPALALQAVTGLDIYLSIVLMGLLCTTYTMQGGMRAVIWTDVLQVGTLLGAAIVSLALVVAHVEGGLGAVARIASDNGKLHMFTWSWSATIASVWVVVIGNIFTNLVPYTADQAVIQRYLTTSSERQAARAVWTASLLTLPTSVLFFGVGTALYVFYRTHPSLLHPAVATDATFAWFIGRQLPVGVSGLVVAGVFAAAMSTLSSGINSITAALVTDFYGRFRTDATDAARMRLARRLTILVGLGGTISALMMATWNIRSLWDLFLQSIGLLGGGLAGVFALGIFTRRAHGIGALVGLAASALLLHFVQQHTAVHFFLYAAIGGTTCMVVGYITSLFIPSRSPALDGLTVFTQKRNRVPFRARKGARFLFYSLGLALASTTLAASDGAPVETDVYVAGHDGYHTYRIPSVIATPKGTLLAFAEARREGRGDAGNIDLVLKRSTDEGKSWSAMRVIGDNGPNTFGNPCPVVDRSTGTIWLLTTQNLGEDSEQEIIDQTAVASRTVWIMKSRDDGLTWSAPFEITRSVKRPEWTWYATGPGVGIQTRSGRLVVPANHAVAGTGGHRSHVFFSDDHGASWQLGGHSVAGTNESQVVELADGRLMLNMRNHPSKPANFRAVALSQDEGRSFAVPVYDRTLVEPPAQASLLRLSLTSTHGRNPLLFANPASTKRERMTVRLSHDEGTTWPVSRVIHEGPAAYSSLVVLSDDTIGLLYERGDKNPYEKLTFARFGLGWLTE
ncbi:MAG: sodium/solute symporter [Luteitalea sp.]|nr:sodium/solute symporter [Luteitalea sp.]